jgi:hypothetical protein
VSKKQKKPAKSHLTAEEKKSGKTALYILVAIIVIGGALGLYFTDVINS